MNHPLMGFYTPFVSPFVKAFLIAYVTSVLSISAPGVRDKTIEGAIVGIGFWLVSALPGVMLDFSAFKMSFWTAVSWWTTSLLNDICTTSVIYYVRSTM